MGEHEAWAQPCGLLPNGFLPNAGPLIQLIDSDGWLRAEERTEELITSIQPNQPSEERRNAVANYVQQLIMKCFPCQVFTFGSVPLKTYLPDGDIDLTAFSNNQTLKDTWASQVRDMLENEEKNENAEFHVKEVQYIQAEVKIIKCLVENIVVDISFNQLGGLCTLCFLEEVDNLINHNHLFKRSIILIKAWCYYESRILGAHHGLISTYALETLVLYIFHVFNNSFTGPLEVLYRFLEFFSNFDWENFCVSLWGPVPISSLPDVAAEPPRKDSGELLLSKLFLDSCSTAYAVFPSGQENQGQPFISKHFNVIDPLRINNNLGRSVSKGNFFRIRSAFAFGAKRLARLLDCPKENVLFEVNQFFTNTWDRHGSGHRPDAPLTELSCLGLSTPNHWPGSENVKHNASGKNLTDNSYRHEQEVEEARFHGVSSLHGNCRHEGMSRTSDASAASRAQTPQNYGNVNSSRISDKIVGEVKSNQVPDTQKNQRTLKSDQLMNNSHGRFPFVRTRSSPELTDTYTDVSSRGRRNRPPESGKNQVTSSRTDSNRRKNFGSDISGSQSGRSSIDEPSSVRHVPPHQSRDSYSGVHSGANTYHRDSGLGAMGEEVSSATETQMMHQEEQDFVNLMASSMVHGFNGQVHMPLNLASPHLPFPISTSVLASNGYAQRNCVGMVTTPMMDPSFSNMQYPHGLFSPPLTHYFSGIELPSNSEDIIEQGNENYGSLEMITSEAENDFWKEHDVGSTGGFDSDNGNLEIHQSDDKQLSTSAGFNYVPSPRFNGSGISSRVQQKFNKENRWPMRDDNLDNYQYQDKRGSEISADDRIGSSRFSSTTHSSHLRSKTSSESSWDGLSTKGSKSARERQGKKTVQAEPSIVSGKGKGTSEHAYTRVDEDDKDWNYLSNTSAGITERTSGPQPVASLSVSRHQIPGYEAVQMTGADSVTPIDPLLLGHGSRQRAVDSSGVPFAFYPTGPPVPFLAMLPVYNIPSETGTSDSSTSHFGGEEGLGNSDSGQNFNSSEALEQSEDYNRRTSSVQTPVQHKSDILHSDFPSHWQNLQFGRFCQNPRYHGPVIYPSPFMVPPMYLPGSGGRPPSNMNLFTQLVSYGPRLFPVAPLQSVSSRPPDIYQCYVDDVPRYRSGTGTYLPNPKVSVRDRHSSGTRRGSFNYDRSDNHGDRDGNWNMNSKTRAAGRSHNRNQAEKSSSRFDRVAASDSRSDRSWSSYRHDSGPSHQSQNGPGHSNSNQSGIPNMAFGMYPLPAMNLNGVSSNGPTVPSVVMLYPFDHNASHGSHSEQLEFGSLGPLVFSGTSEQSQPSEGGRARGAFEEHRHPGGSVQRSSPDQPSSPRLQRRK